MGLEGLDRVFFYSLCFREALVIVEVDEVGGPIVLASLLAFRAIPSEMSYFSALEACVRRVSHCGHVALEVVLRAVPLITVGVLSSAEVAASIVSSIVPSCWCPVPIYVHRNRSVVHPAWSV